MILRYYCRDKRHAETERCAYCAPEKWWNARIGFSRDRDWWNSLFFDAHSFPLEFFTGAASAQGTAARHAAMFTLKLLELGELVRP